MLIDPPKTPQPADGLPIRFGLRDLRQPGIKLQQPGLGVIDGQQVIVNDFAFGRMRPRLSKTASTGERCPIRDLR